MTNQTLLGQMMGRPLLITSIMEFAERVYPNVEVVSQISPTEAHRYTFADAFRRVRMLANALCAAGVQQGDRIGTLAFNHYRHFEIYYAVSCMGAVCHTINPRLSPEQLVYVINHASDAVLFIDPVFVPLLEEIRGQIKQVRFVAVLGERINSSRLPTSVEGYEELIAHQPDTFLWPTLDERTASSLCYTSGTTGNPKGVLYSHRSTVLHSYAMALPDSFNLSVRDVVMPAVPMFHVNAWGLPYACPMVGAKMVLPGSYMGNSEVLLRLITEEGVTFSGGVPTVWLGMLEHLRNRVVGLGRLKRLVIGGAACPQSLMDALRERYGVEVIHAWGMTELSPVGTVNSLKPGMERMPADMLSEVRLSQGRPVFGVDFKIVDEAGAEQPWDGSAVGEVKVRGAWVCSGYYGHSETNVHDSDGWFATGDIASFDAEGYMRIADRTKDVIKSGGEWISSIELENAALGHPAVREAAVIGIPHPKWTERPLLIVVRAADTPLETRDLLTWLEGKVANWWIPDDVVFVDEIPHTSTGKISKMELRSRFKNYASLPS